jgi:hypothetical protein
MFILRVLVASKVQSQNVPAGGGTIIRERYPIRDQSPEVVIKVSETSNPMW